MSPKASGAANVKRNNINQTLGRATLKKRGSSFASIGGYNQKTFDIKTTGRADVEATYQNILPSNLRHGNKNVMPLLPPKMDKIGKLDQALLRRVIQNSSYTLS